MKRKSLLIKGYDCRDRCRDPRHKDTFGKPYATPGQSHGQHGDEWRYTVTDGESAIVLTVHANEASSIARWPKPPEGAHISFHHPWPLHDEQVRERDQGSECDAIPAGRCYGDATYRYAEEFFREHGLPQFEQPERFWVAFEKYATEAIAESKATAAGRTRVRCPTCSGSGVVSEV